MIILEVKGSETDWDGLNKARTEQWEKVAPHTYHCGVHSTYFDPDGYAENDFEDAEPCWQCYHEFERNL